MTHDQIMLVRLRNEVKAEISLVDKLVEEYRNLPTEIDDSYKNRIKASIFHDFYTGSQRNREAVLTLIEGMHHAFFVVGLCFLGILFRNDRHNFVMDLVDDKAV